MDVLQVSGAASANLQGLQGSFHPPRMADMVNRMVSTIDDAVNIGKLTDAQAAPMRRDLSEVAKALQQNQNGSASGKQTGDRQRIGSEIRDIGKQLKLALESQPTAAGIDNKNAAGADAPRGERQPREVTDINPTYGRNGRFSPAVQTPQSTFSLVA
ncbi:MAG: hypothetical protein MUF22_04660 [Chitinispirillaceae bacterium]|jgi:hypothetical protein|nr:hypothetical protein [Chitinispirillaceae bacterium]